jgi:hypothetical protein
MTIKERIKTFIKYKKISERSFCRAIGVSETFVSSMRTSFQPDKMHNISQQYPDLNTGWLMTGEGEMLKSEAVIKELATCTNCFSLQKELEMKEAMIKLQDKLIAEYEFQLGKKKNSNCG